MDNVQQWDNLKEPYTLDDIIQSMSHAGWIDEPIDIIKMPEGGYTSIDNTRVLAAKRVGINVNARVHNYNSRLPENMLSRFRHPRIPDDYAETWGEALEFRIFTQSLDFQNENFPLGSYNEPRVIYSESYLN